MTRQAPLCAAPNSYLAPRRARSPRSTERSGLSPLQETVTGAPLLVRDIMAIPYDRSAARSSVWGVPTTGPVHDRISGKGSPASRTSGRACVGCQGQFWKLVLLGS